MIYLELVPRNLEQLCTDSKLYLDSFSDLTGINIPDITRLPIRSTKAANALLEHQITVIPHIRTQDAALDDHLSMISRLYQHGLRHVLLISGDPDDTTMSYDVTPPILTKHLKQSFSDLIIYCGIDPYRQSFDEECRYTYEKLEAGADGLFSQPFFDVSLLETFLKSFSSTQFFCGISPVTSQRSLEYWQTINRVSFPQSFDLSFAYNVSLAKDLLACSQYYNQHAYLMPIRTPVKEYLESVFT